MWNITVLMTLTGMLAAAADPSYRETPLDVGTEPYSDGVTRVTVEWGSQGDSLKRNPQEVRDQFNQLETYLHSDATKQWLHRQQARAEIKEHAQGKQLVADWQHAYTAVPQIPETPASSVVTTRQVEIPEWATSLTWEIRKTLMIGAYDAASPPQVAWAEHERTEHPELQLFAVGWSSLKEYSHMQREHPIIQGNVVTTTARHSVDQWLADYAITALPAVVQFPDPTHMLVTQGTGP